MELIAGGAPPVSRLGVFPGAFNPPTRAHLALACAAVAEVDAVLFVLPRQFPHKEYEGANLADRLRLLRAALAGEPRFGVALSDGGLFLDIARECRALYGGAVELAFLCGRDAAERIVNWDYGAPDAVRGMLDEFELLVASRQGSYEPPPEIRARIRPLALPAGLSEVSASEVRRRIRRGEAWEELVPEAVVELVRVIYQAG